MYIAHTYRATLVFVCNWGKKIPIIHIHIFIGYTNGEKENLRKVLHDVYAIPWEWIGNANIIKWTSFMCVDVNIYGYNLCVDVWVSETCGK